MMQSEALMIFTTFPHQTGMSYLETQDYMSRLLQLITALDQMSACERLTAIRNWVLSDAARLCARRADLQHEQYWQRLGQADAAGAQQCLIARDEAVACKSLIRAISTPTH